MQSAGSLAAKGQGSQTSQQAGMVSVTDNTLMESCKTECNQRKLSCRIVEPTPQIMTADLHDEGQEMMLSEQEAML